MSLITQFYPNRAVDGNTGDSSFGRVLRAADPLIGQIAAKANFQQERGRLGRASRANGTGIDNSDVALHKLTNFTARSLELRLECSMSLIAHSSIQTERSMETSRTLRSAGRCRDCGGSAEMVAYSRRSGPLWLMHLQGFRLRADSAAGLHTHIMNLAASCRSTDRSDSSKV